MSYSCFSSFLQVPRSFGLLFFDLKFPVLPATSLKAPIKESSCFNISFSKDKVFDKSSPLVYLKRYSTQKPKFVESYIFIFYLSRCFSFFSKMFLHLPAAFPAKKCGSGGQYSGLQWPVFWAPKSSIQSSEASILGSKASTSSSMASTLAP